MAKDPAFIFKPESWKTPNTYDLNFSLVPNRSGVYLLVVPTLTIGQNPEYKIMYVGSAIDLSVRYSKHEVKRALSKIYGYVQFYFKETDNYRIEEIALIKSIRPKFNTQHNGA